ncbi:FIG138056: a glutathione-dependent thiol reductase [hydrothermal vent metagenome]|uniref:FIG138056: a glutathione-dependent thiol reductase n=1 Tax=hydrothermal vent metagenome TaxID=652676 RepID=A0A3B0WCI9_9ZZZZ
MILYGIPNCDTVRKARKFLENHQTPYQFHDFKKDGISLERLQTWLAQHPITTLVNKRSVSWRQLNEAQKEALISHNDLSILMTHPTLIKRPILQIEGTKNSTIIVGLKEIEKLE